jgi:hypothetical protein
MDKESLEHAWRDYIRSPTIEKFETLADTVVERWDAGDQHIRTHIRNRVRPIYQLPKEEVQNVTFGLNEARAIIVFELGYDNWSDLEGAIRDRMDLLFHYAVAAMDRGDFSGLESMVGGPEHFGDQIFEWYEKGLFENEPETLAEVFSAGKHGTATGSGLASR